jgi:hypothetical protein
VLVDTEYAFYCPGGLDIDVNPHSENFGMIYCTEAIVPHTPNAKYFTHYYNNGTLTASAGLFVFDAAFQNMPSFDKDETTGEVRYDFVSPNNNRTFARCYNLGLSQTYHSGTQAVWDTYNPLAPRRVRLSDDGRLFVSLYSGTKSIVKELNPARLRYDYRLANGKLNNSGWFWDLFTGATWNTSQYRWEDASGNIIIAPNVGLDVRGSGSNLKLFAVSGDKGLGGNSDRESCHFGEFNIGTATSWNKKPNNTNYFNFTKKDPSTGNNRTWTNCLGFSQWDRTATTATLVKDKNGDGINDGTPINAVVFYDYVNFEYDQYGGIWMCQHRANQTEAAAIAHINTSGKVDFTDHVIDRSRGGVRYTHDFSKLVVAGGQRGRKWIATNHTIKHQDHHGAVFNSDKTQVELPCVELKWATIYTVKHTSGTSKPVFTDSVYVYLDILPMDFAWDYAGNLYAASASSERVCAYAMPNGGKPVVTPCRDTSYIENTNVSQLTVKFVPNTIPVGTACDNDYQYMDKYNESLNGFNLYYRRSAKFQLLGQPADGYQFYCWLKEDGVTKEKVGETVSSQSVMDADGVTRTALYGISVWENKPLKDFGMKATFPGAFVRRELDNESYSTICLPFELKSLVGTPYEGASVKKFVGTHTSGDPNDKRVFLDFEELSFVGDDYMHAGVPYLIQLAAGKENIAKGTEVIFHDVDFPYTGVGNGKEVTDGNNLLTFKGFINPTEFSASKTRLFMTADNRLIMLNKQTTLNGLRGYFELNVPVSADMEYVVNFPDKAPTDVPVVPMMTDTMKVTKYLWNGNIYIQKGGLVYDISGSRIK